MKTAMKNLTKLFWTGGWDSTYRLLDLLLIQKEQVQPIYIMDPNRMSMAHELKTMQKIKKMVEENYPHERRLLLPTMYFELNDIEPNDKITNAYKRILQTQPALGIQNDWLARFTYQYDMKNIEIAVQKSSGPMFSALIKILERQESNGEISVRVKNELKGQDEYLFFRNFCFPLTEINKLEMLKKSKENGFFKLMEQTWFCHHPLPSGKPCGVCVPCVGVMKDGMSFRMPLSSKLRYYFRVFLSSEQLKKEYPQIHGLLRRFKHLISK